MKILTAYVASYVLFWLGDGVSRLMHKADWLSFLYPAYVRLMFASSDIEEWAGIEFMWKEEIKAGGTD